MFQINIAKFVFRKLSLIYNTTSEIEIYIKYLEKALDFKLNFDSITSGLKLDRALAKDFYGDQHECPRFFNYKKYSDWSRLNNSIMLENECLGFYLKRKNGDYIKIYDECIINKLFHLSQNFVITRHMFIISQNKDGQLEMEYTTNITSPFIYPGISELKFMSKNQTSGKEIASLINFFIDSGNNKSKLLQNHWNFDFLTSDPSLLDFVKKPILLCSHIGSKINWRSRNYTYNHFSPLALYNENINIDPIIICLTLDQNENVIIAYEPEEQIKKKIVKQCIVAPGRVSDAHEYIKNISSPRCRDINKLEEKEKTIEKWWNNYPCKCDTCSFGRENYSLNIALNGPQQRTSIELDTLEYLQFFNLKNDHILQNLEKSYDLSIAALDIECYNEEISEPKQKINNLSYIGSSSIIISKQEMCLIDYGDHFMNQKPDHKIFRVTKSDQVQQIVDELLNHIFSRHEIIMQEKTKLLAPLFNFINKYRYYHNEFWTLELQKNESLNANVIEKIISDSFDNSLIGKFNQHLEKIKKMLFIYAHNGGMFDWVFLHRYFASHLKLKGFRKPLNTIKRESRFVKISIPTTGICFVDSMDMIGIKCSLAKLAELTGQTDTKMIFPFKCFTSPEFLKQPKLPSKKTMWYNDLQQRYYSDEEIKEAHKAFQEVGAKNIGEYLESYLQSKYNSLI